MANAIRYLADNPALACEMGAAGRTAIEQRYNRNTFSHQFSRIIEEMVR